MRRLKDVILGGEDLETLRVMEKFPISMASVDAPAKDDKFADLVIAISRSSGLIQLKELLPLDSLYSYQTTRSAIGNLWKKHHDLFADFIKYSRPARVLEIGGAHGYLAKTYCEGSPIPWQIVEPAPAPVDGCPAEFIQAFFGPDIPLAPDQLIVHSHLLEHIYDPNDFLRDLANRMELGQEMIFSIPDLETWIKRKYTNSLNFEHSILLTIEHVEFLLAQTGFDVIRRLSVLEGHSVFYHVRRGEPKSVDLPSGLFQKNKKHIEDFFSFHESFVLRANHVIDSSNSPVFLFGAHIFAQFLIAFGLNQAELVGILDNDPEKQGKRLFGTTLSVHPVTRLDEEDSALVVLHAGAYNQEIKESILATTRCKVEFVTG